MQLQGLKHRQKVKSPQKEKETEEEEETKFPLAFHAEGNNSFLWIDFFRLAGKEDGYYFRKPYPRP